MAFPTTKATALVAFVRYVEDHGQVVGDPDSSLTEAQKPEVPSHLIDAWVADGLISTGKAPVKAEAKPEPAAEQAP